MRVGIPTEIKNNEYRVAIPPAGVSELVVGAASFLVGEDVVGLLHFGEALGGVGVLVDVGVVPARELAIGGLDGGGIG